MRDDLASLLKRQAAWQRSRAKMSWSEKLRLSVVMRRSSACLRKVLPSVATGGARSPR